MEHIRFSLTSDTRREVEKNIDQSIMRIYDEIHGTQETRKREELTLRMEWIVKLRNRIIDMLIGVLK